MVAMYVGSFQSARGEAERDKGETQLVHDLQNMNELDSTSSQCTNEKGTT